MQKLNLYWEEEKKMKPKRENWRDRKNKIKKCNIVGTKPHLFAIYMYSDCATHIQRRICMHVECTMYTILKEEENREEDTQFYQMCCTRVFCQIDGSIELDWLDEMDAKICNFFFFSILSRLLCPFTHQQHSKYTWIRSILFYAIHNIFKMMTIIAIWKVFSSLFLLYLLVAHVWYVCFMKSVVFFYHLLKLKNRHECVWVLFLSIAKIRNKSKN